MRKHGARNNGMKQVSFQVSTQPGCAVYVAGTFNDWRPGDVMLKEVDGRGLYQTKLRLPPGRHEYKFIVGEEWCVDPACPEVTTNEFGSLNSVIHVP